MDALQGFFDLITTNFYEPMLIIMQNNAFILKIIEKIDLLFQSVFGTINNFIDADFIAAAITFVLFVWLTIFIFKLFINCFSFIKSSLTNTIKPDAEKKEWRRQWRRKKK